MEGYIYQLLEVALDADIAECIFWEMTPAEVNRAIEAFNRKLKRNQQNQASFDYIQANLIVKGVSICLGDKSKMPSLEEVYPTLFAEDVERNKEIIQSKKDELSALRFKQFAQSYNEKFKQKEVLKAENE